MHSRLSDHIYLQDSEEGPACGHLPAFPSPRLLIHYASSFRYYSMIRTHFLPSTSSASARSGHRTIVPCRQQFNTAAAAKKRKRNQPKAPQAKKTDPHPLSYCTPTPPGLAEGACFGGKQPPREQRPPPPAATALSSSKPGEGPCRTNCTQFQPRRGQDLFVL